MTKERVTQLIQTYADGCGVQAIKDALGTGGSSWQGDYAQGMYAICEGISDAINEDIDDESGSRQERDEQIRAKLNELIASYMQLLGSYRFYHPNETGAPDVLPLE